MNKDFKLTADTAKIPVRGKKGEYTTEAVLRLSYKDVVIAKWQGTDERALYLDAQKYVDTYGYLAEWNRRWQLQEFEPNTEWVQWNDSLFVNIA